MLEQIQALLANGQKVPEVLVRELLVEHQALREACCNSEVENDVLHQETEYLGTRVSELEKTLTNLQLSLATANRAVLQLRSKLEELQNPQNN